MGKFIYVIDKSLRDLLLAEGYVMVSQSDKGSLPLWIFENNPDKPFSTYGNNAKFEACCFMRDELILTF